MNIPKNETAAEFHKRWLREYRERWHLQMEGRYYWKFWLWLLVELIGSAALLIAIIYSK